MKQSSGFAFQLLFVALIVPAHAAMAREKSDSLVDRASCQYNYDIGLGWGLCHVPELKVTVLAIEEKQRRLTRVLDRRTADALAVNWKRFIDRLASEVGSKWFEDAKADVAASLNGYRRFLESIDATPPAGPFGHWENSMARVSITQKRSGVPHVEIDAPGCMVPPYDSGAILLDREGAGLELTLARKAYVAAYPSAVGCFSDGPGPSAIDGIYFAMRSVSGETAP